MTYIHKLKAVLGASFVSKKINKLYVFINVNRLNKLIFATHIKCILVYLVVSVAVGDDQCDFRLPLHESLVKMVSKTCR